MTPPAATPPAFAMWRQLLCDETGAEALEYALVLGLLVTGVIGIVYCIGTKVLTAWTQVNLKVDGASTVTVVHDTPPAAPH